MKIERGMIRNGISVGIVYKRKIHNDFDNKDYSQITICFITCYVCISWVETNKKTKKRRKQNE